MAFIQIDPVTHNAQRINTNGAAEVFAIVESEVQDAIQKGRAYNINTGEVSISAETAMLYIKNDQENTLVVERIIVGLGTTANASDIATVTLIRNPTAGTILTTPVDVSINANRNGGSSNELASTTLAYKGASGETFTDGTDWAFLYADHSDRSPFPIDFDLEKGSTLGVKVNPRLSSGNVNCYVAVLVYEVDPKNKPS